MRYAIAILMVSILAAPAEAARRDYRYMAAAIIVLKRQAKPTPAPTPTPVGKCDNCNGTGKLGDGVVSVPCPVCGGDGIASNEPASPPVDALPARRDDAGASLDATFVAIPRPLVRGNCASGFCEQPAQAPKQYERQAKSQGVRPFRPFRRAAGFFVGRWR